MANLNFAENICQQEMSVYKQHLKKHQVRLILLVHGTFAGDDAFGLFDLLDPINKRLADKLKNKGKRLINRLTKDMGNNTPEYADTLRGALDNEIIYELFVWSSANFHLARLQGAIELAQTLAEKITQNNILALANERLLLMGHSHAGQLFALLTNFWQIMPRHSVFTRLWKQMS
jgi:methionyl-tRNA synthetase